MAKVFRSWDADQGWLLPPSLHEFVPPGHMAHCVRDTGAGADRARLIVLSGHPTRLTGTGAVPPWKPYGMRRDASRAG